MNENHNIIKEATGHFPFTFWIEKATATEHNGKMVVEGVASTGNVDHDKERMSQSALMAMVDVVNQQGVPLRIEHSQKDNAIVGVVNKGWLDDRGQFWIRAELDPSHMAAPILYNALKSGGRYGLSVGGFVKRAVEEMVEGVGHAVKTFYDIVLDEVSITQHPSNYDAIGLKAVKSRTDVGTDYLQAFAKSIPADEWHRVDKNYKLEDKSMAKETEDEKTTKAEETTEEKKTKASDKKEEETDVTKTVTQSEFKELVKFISTGFNAMTDALSKVSKAGLSVEAKDKQQPGEDKSDPEATQEAKVKATTKADAAAADQKNPDKAKKDPEETQEAKVKAREGQDSRDGNGDDEDGAREKAAKPADSKDTDTYDMATVERSIKRIQEVSKAMDSTDEKDEKKDKAFGDSETEDDKSKKAFGDTDEKTTKSIGLSSIDTFAVTVAETIERMQKSMEKNGFQTSHIAGAVINQIKTDPEYQALIKGMLREPGRKKSVIMGTPFVKTRDGRMFKLVNEEHPQSKVEKSEDGKKLSFKDQWGKSFSSTQEEQ